MNRKSTVQIILTILAAGMLLLFPSTADMVGKEPIAGNPSQSVHRFLITDRYGNTVRDGERRFNYVIGPYGNSAKIEINEQNQVITRQSLLAFPFSATPAHQKEVVAEPSASSEAGSDPTAAKLEWKYGLFGSGIGLSRIAVFDIDHDSKLEMVMGGSQWTFGGDDFWYVVRQTGLNSYDQVWSSNPYTATIMRIAVADSNADNVGEIYVGLSNGTVQIFNGVTLTETGSLVAGSAVSALVIADADGDGAQEIVTSDGAQIYVYASDTLTQEWASTAYGGSDLAIGNVDADPAPEIVSASGYVLDGAAHTMEWPYAGSEGFGRRVRLGDIDGDGMAEIIGAASWYKVTAFDADIHSPKWEIPTSHDIGALNVSDINGDSIPEVLFGDGQWGAIHCYDALTQTQKWAINNPEHGVTDIAVGDVNNDGTLEIMWGAGATSTGPDYLYVADTVSHAIEWQNVHLDGPLSAVDVGDVDDDGRLDIVMVSDQSQSGYADGIIHIFDAATHALKWRSTDLPGITAWSGVSSVKIGDVDGDGQTEFVITTADLYDGLFQVYDGRTRALERQSAKYSGASFTALALGDVDNDGKTEIVVGQKREHTGATGVYLIVFDGATAAEEWKSVGLDTYWGYVYDIKLADTDRDGHVEMFASVAGEKMYAFDGVTHQQDWFISLPANAIETSDVDSDSTVEVLVGKSDGAIDVYDGVTFAPETSFTLSTGSIAGLRLGDIDQNGKVEWLISAADQLSIFNGATKELLWQSDDLGSSLANLNQIAVKNLDSDANQEVVLGSVYALYQFEVTQSMAVIKQAAPNPVRAGAPLTYTIRVTNNYTDNLHTTITDTLPTQVTLGQTSGGTVLLPGGTITWTPIITAPGGVWTETIVVTVTPGYAGWLTNTVQATSEEGPSGVYTATTLSLAPSLEVAKCATPDPVQAGAPLTYTIRVTNTGTMDLHATITDTLPAQLTSGRTSSGTVILPGQIFTWTAFIPTGEVWTETVVGTVAWGYTGTLTNVVQVTTVEGATGSYTATSQSLVTPALSVTKQANSLTVRAGEQLTYTIRITNTGNITLTGLVTDTLPVHITPTGVQTWTLVNLSPGSVWAQPLVVAVTQGYSGTLINRVQVATEEGARGETQVSVNVIGYQIYLPIVLK